MQHPDEGTIHSWLDNALSAEEAAQVESHVAECEQCAAAVAEARGFIAASSRILTALDDVPRGVMPAAPARKRDFRVLWRTAAAVLVVAGGSLIVLRDGAREERASSTIADGAVVVDTSTPGLAADAGATAGMMAEVAPQPRSASTSERRAASPPARSDKVAPATEKDLSATIVVRGRASGMAGGAIAQSAGTNAATAPSAAMRTPANAVTSESEAPALKILRVERAIGGRRTIYEIAPTDTVTLTETEPLSLSAVVTTGVATGEARQEKAGRTRAVAPMQAEPTAATAPTQKEGAVNAPRSISISWFEAATGKTLVLSGKIPVERLQEIKRRIEMERAASSKKNP